MKSRAHYGIDAPSVFHTTIVFGCLFALASLVGKKRVRDRLVAALALSGHERVLDAGCGRGLALIACAQKLPLLS